MFKYVLQPLEQKLYVFLPNKLKFNCDFLNATAELLYYIENAPCSQVFFHCKEKIGYDKLSKAYLYNVMNYVRRKKKAFWNPALESTIQSTVRRRKGGETNLEIDLLERLSSDELNLYSFQGDTEIQQPVNSLTKAMVDKSLTINETEVREFLSTTIGEIFSNSINHSEQETTYFMFDVVYENEKFFLYVNIVDYGSTIVGNVGAHLARTHGIELDSASCISWAIEPGNTTRGGSGGYGLPTLINYIKAVDGDLFIFSGNAYYRLEHGNTEISKADRCLFPGTSVTFKVELLRTTGILKYDSQHKQLVCIDLDSI